MTRPLAVCAILFVLTVAVYWPVTGHGYISYDDPIYVGVPQVREGLTPRSIAWAFQFGRGHAGNYHPLAWLSHMLDFQLLGPRPGGQHLVSVIMHAAAAAALLWFLWRTTGALWLSAATAALFAWHPMHVESVAWMAERKDVLSGLMFCLMLMAYARYGDEPSVGRYLLVVTLFALGLLAKPMLVTAPFVLLLVDRWPLKRQLRWNVVLLEKLPLIVIAGASAVVTYLAQQREGAVRSDESLPLRIRLMNVPVAYVRYLLKLVWPSHLSVFYPYEVWAPAHVVAATGFLVIVTILLLIACRRGRAYALVGWLWFLGTLVPVIGIVQVGSQSMADRYSYLPSIGLFVMICFAAAGWANTEVRSSTVAIAAGGAILAMLIITRLQLRHWRDDLALFEHAASVTRFNHVAELYIAKSLVERKDAVGAIQHYDRSLEYNPRYYEAHYNQGNLLLRLGQYNSAADSYRRAIDVQPKSTEARNNLAIALILTNDPDNAETAVREAINIDPDYAEAHATLGRLLLRRDKKAEAAAEFRLALSLRPQLEAAQRGLEQATTQP